MRLGGPARFMTDATTPDEVAELCRHAKANNIPIFILGGGSNTVAKDEGFQGLVIRNRIMGFTKVTDDDQSTTFEIGAGEIWDEVVKRTVELNLSGCEAMSAIPGTAGAAPVQNIGAYGQELAETLVSLNAYDIQDDRQVTLSSEDCGFSYRHSIFRGEAAGRYVITSITLRLHKTIPTPPFYDALQKYFDEKGETFFTAQTVRDSVMSIRFEKLPDPTQKPNSGSFFKNAIVEEWQLEGLLKDYPDMPHFDLGNKTYKVPTGWLIEQCGFKGKLLHGMRVHDKNCLVLINESATSYQDLAAAREEIHGAVRDRFRISITQEPLEL